MAPAGSASRRELLYSQQEQWRLLEPRCSGSRRFFLQPSFLGEVLQSFDDDRARKRRSCFYARLEVGMRRHLTERRPGAFSNCSAAMDRMSVFDSRTIGSHSARADFNPDDHIRLVLFTVGCKQCTRKRAGDVMDVVSDLPHDFEPGLHEDFLRFLPAHLLDLFGDLRFDVIETVETQFERDLSELSSCDCRTRHLKAPTVLRSPL